MTLETKAKDIRVTFKDYGFFVPINLVGKNILAQGTLSVHKMSLEETKHMASDAGKNPDLVTKAAKEYRFVASGLSQIE